MTQSITARCIRSKKSKGLKAKGRSPMPCQGEIGFESCAIAHRIAKLLAGSAAGVTERIYENSLFHQLGLGLCLGRSLFVRNSSKKWRPGHPGSGGNCGPPMAQGVPGATPH